MYSLKNLFTKNPIQISGAVVTVLNALVLMEVWTPSTKVISGINVALISVLGLFVVSNTVNAAKLGEYQDDTLAAIQLGRDLQTEKVSQATTKKVAKAVTKKTVHDA